MLRTAATSIVFFQIWVRTTSLCFWAWKKITRRAEIWFEWRDHCRYGRLFCRPPENVFFRRVKKFIRFTGSCISSWKETTWLGYGNRWERFRYILLLHMCTCAKYILYQQREYGIKNTSLWNVSSPWVLSSYSGRLSSYEGMRDLYAVLTRDIESQPKVMRCSSWDGVGNTSPWISFWTLRRNINKVESKTKKKNQLWI